MAWTIEYAESVQKTFRKLDPAARNRLRDLLERRVAPSDDPRLLGKRLSGPLGDYWVYRGVTTGRYAIFRTAGLPSWF